MILLFHHKQGMCFPCDSSEKRLFLEITDGVLWVKIMYILVDNPYYKPKLDGNSSGWKTEPSLNARLESLDQTGFVAGLRLVSGVFFESKRFYEGSKFQRPILYCLVSRLC